MHNKITAVNKLGDRGINDAKGIVRKAAYSTVLIGASL
jgi:hypothetical protein